MKEEVKCLTPKRTEYGKKVRSLYEKGKMKISRHKMTKLQPREDGLSNTLTTVQKDNLILVPGTVIGNTQRNCAHTNVNSNSPTLTAAMGMGGGHVPMIVEDNKDVQNVVKQVENMVKNRKGGHTRVVLQSDGTIRPRQKRNGKDFCVDEGVIQSENNQAMTLTTVHKPKVYGNTTKYRIRRLTERECFRLMGVEEPYIDKLVSNISATQCYKLAGNSIVVHCLFHIFRKMFVEKENESSDGQLSLF